MTYGTAARGAVSGARGAVAACKSAPGRETSAYCDCVRPRSAVRTGLTEGLEARRSRSGSPLSDDTLCIPITVLEESLD